MKKIVVSCALAIVVSSSAFAFELKMPKFGGGADSKQQKAQDLLDDAKRAYGSAQFPKAIALATSAIGESPKFALAYLVRGKAYKDVGNVDNSSSIFPASILARSTPSRPAFSSQTSGYGPTSKSIVCSSFSRRPATSTEKP